MSYLIEAFKALNALDEDVFSVSDDGIEKLSAFEDDDVSDDITVYDVDAEDESELEGSYVGKVILDCNVCHSKLYKDKADVVIDDESNNANIDMECPYCYSVDGFKIVGEVAPFMKESEESNETKELEETSEVEESAKVRRVVKESFNFDYSRKVTDPFNWESEDQDVMIDALTDEGFYADSESRGEGEGTVYYYDSTTDEEVFSQSLQDEYSDMEDLWNSAIEEGKTYAELKDDIRTYYANTLQESFKREACEVDALKKPVDDDTSEIIQESVKDVTITTDDSKTTMTSEDDGRVTVTTEPVEHVDEEETVVAPVSDETEVEIETNSDDMDADIEDIDADSFEESLSSILKEQYDNVTAYKMSSCSFNNDAVTVNGVIEFASGKKGNSQIKLESHTIDKNGNTTFLTESTRAFSTPYLVSGNLKDKKFITESIKIREDK